MSNGPAPSLLQSKINPNMFSAFDLSAPSIHAVAGARIYHTQLDAKKYEWTYSRLKGTLTFGRNWDSTRFTEGSRGQDDQYWFMLADETTGKTIWMFQIPANLQYEVDRPFFHIFNGRTRKYGFLFEDDDAAALFSKKVLCEACKEVIPKRSRSIKSLHARSASLNLPISRSQISSPAPNSFRHLSHIGVGRAGVFEVSKDLDSSFKEMLMKLQHAGGGAANVIVQENLNFSDSFWRDIDAKRAANPGDDLASEVRLGVSVSC